MELVIGFFELGVLLDDSDKTIKLLQDSGLITNDVRKDCKFCGMQRSVALHKKSKQIIVYTLMCLQCRRSVSGESNTWFESVHISLGCNPDYISPKFSHYHFTSLPKIFVLYYITYYYITHSQLIYLIGHLILNYTLYIPNMVKQSQILHKTSESWTRDSADNLCTKNNDV